MMYENRIWVYVINKVISEMYDLQQLSLIRMSKNGFNAAANNFFSYLSYNFINDSRVNFVK